MSLDLNAQKELFSDAYLHAVTARAGFLTSKRQLDRDSVDWNISSADDAHLPRRPHLELQLKCSADDALRDADFPFPLSVANYDDLRVTELVVPRILLVVRVPPDIDDWMAVTEGELLMRKCGYWVSLKGEPPVDNTSTVTVAVPRAQMFHAESLAAIMTRINDGLDP